MPTDNDSLELQYACTKCSQESNPEARGTRGSSVEFRDIEPLFKMIGEMDIVVLAKNCLF